MIIFLVLLIENLLFPIVALAFAFKFAFSRRRSLLRDLPVELPQRLGRIPEEILAKISGRKPIWIHAASAGEVAAVSELIRRIKSGKLSANQTPHAIIVTTSTAAGRDQAARLADVDAALLAPLDCYPAVSKFLSELNPQILLIAETELWPHMIELSFRRGIKIAVINGRISERSFARLQLFRFLVRPFLRRIDRFAVQNNDEIVRFNALGADETHIQAFGNLKYDVKPVLGPSQAVEKAFTALGWTGCPVFVAGSTHPVEEDILLDAYTAARRDFPSLKIVLAPRHAERAHETSRNLKLRGIPSQSWSTLKGAPANALVLDVMGILPAFYGRAFLSFVGGTLVPIGGHNIMEPALAGCAVAFGPYTAHVREVARILRESDGAVQVKDAHDLAQHLTDLLAHREKAQGMARSAAAAAVNLQGAVQRTLDYLQDWTAAIY